MSNPIIAVGLIPDDGGDQFPADGHDDSTSQVELAEPVRYTPWQLLFRAMRPSFKGSHLLAGLLCALLGFALVVQVRAASGDRLSGLRQEDLVRLLDDVSTRADQLDEEIARLISTRDELISGTNQDAAALEVARQRAATEGILSGRLPAEGPGIVLEVYDAGRQLHASDLFNLLEELRNAGAEAVQVNDIRITTSSSFVDTDNGPALNGVVLGERQLWTVIGDAATLDRALEIPGGALPKLRGAGAEADAVQQDSVRITATAELTAPVYARPVS